MSVLLDPGSNEGTYHMRTLALALAFGLLVAGPPASLSSAPRPPQVRLETGDMAPDFDLPGSDGKTYRLSDYRGKRAVVLAWFARAFSAG
jgi:peroxiredoxin Q/BCP